MQMQVDKGHFITAFRVREPLIEWLFPASGGEKPHTHVSGKEKNRCKQSFLKLRELFEKYVE